MSDPRKVIEEIRSKMLAPGPNIWRDQMAQSSSHLSEELYPEPMQFIRELLQNADDSEYPKGQQPAIKMSRTSTAFTFESNESGFKESHVRAICGFAGSDKGKDKSRFIGEKGLGFKSVFQISDRPEIHSNGYHFRFDSTQHGGLGRVIPEWIEECKEASGTRIVLPIRANESLPGRDPDDLQAVKWILLFLRKLNDVRYDDEVRRRSLCLQRRIDGDVMSLSHESNTGVSAKLSFSNRVVRQFVDVSAVVEAKRVGFRESEVAVAVPIDKSGRVRLDFKGHAYAYLPVQTTELRFSFNADLLLVTNRSDVLEVEWNKTLCNGLGGCLANAIMSFCAGDDPKSALAIGMLKQPSRTNQPMYAQILATAVEKLKDELCIATAARKWVRPSAAVLPDEAGLVDLVEPEALQRLVGVSRVHPGLTEISAEIEKLGVRRFSLPDLMQCLGDQEWMSTRSTAWFGRLYAKLGEMELRPIQREAFRNVPILRLQDGTTMAPTKVDVYRSMGTTHQYGFEHLLPLLARESCGSESSGTSSASQFLESIGVYALTPKIVIDKYILPFHEHDDGLRLPNEDLVAHACFIIDHLKAYEEESWTESKNPIGKIMANLRIVTRSEDLAKRVRRKASNMYLGAPYKDPYKLEKLWLSQMPERFISPCYRDAAAPQGGAKREWAKFFLALRARETPGIEISKLGENKYCRWREESKSLFQTDDEERKWHFLEIIGDNWDEYHKAIESRSLGDDAELLIDLRAIEVETSLGRRPLRHCYLDNAETRAVFGDAHPFLRGQFISDEFAEVCGVTTKPTIDAVLQRLRQIAATKATDEATAAQVERLYRWLAERQRIWGLKVAQAFASTPIILAARADDGWVTSSAACWSTGGSLGKHCPLRELMPRWKNFHEFFVDHLNVPEAPTPDAWVGFLASVKRAAEPEESARRFARFAYRGLASAYSGGATNPTVVKALRDLESQQLFLCKDGLWRSERNSAVKLVLGDDSLVENCFAKQSAVAFIAVDECDVNDLEPLLRAVNIKRLREEMKIAVPSGRAKVASPHVAEHLRERMMALARVLYHRHRRQFNESMGRSFFNFLAEAEVMCTPSFQVTVGKGMVECAFDAKILGSVARRCLYISSAEPGQRQWNEIGGALAAEVDLSADVGISFGALLVADSVASVESLLQRLDAPPLPPEARRQLPIEDASVDSVPNSDESLEESRGSAEPFSRVQLNQADGSAHSTSTRTDPHGRSRSSSESKDSHEATHEDEFPTRDEDELICEESHVKESLGSAEATRARTSATNPSASSRPSIVRKQFARGRQARLGTYAAADAPPIDEQFNKQVEDAAVEHVLKRERDEGWHAVDMNADHPDHPGFDILSKHPSTGEVRFIEVKGTADQWDTRGVDVTTTQLQHSMEHRELSWLYVVEFALTEEITCHRIRDFAFKVQRIAFDGGWRSYAEP